ncbi:MAG: amidohydrolase family protein [Candidatus Omnitrophica bacterium]|nr:amidohydrolase family protein [Candidatus Omnitrophota bacterium]
MVAPISRPPIDNGCVRISGDRVIAIGPWETVVSSLEEPVIDLGDAVLLPGLVNAHCHMDYTHLAGRIGPTKTFTGWIQAIMTHKAGWSMTNYAQSWAAGAQMLVRSGVTTVADMEAVPALLPETAGRFPLRIFSFLELIGIKKEIPASDVIRPVLDQVRFFETAGGRIGLSPHAPYSTTSKLLRLSVRMARKWQWRLASHVAESEEEFEMFMHQGGPLFEWLKNQRDMSDCGRGSPVQHLEANRVLGPCLLAAHVNYLAPGDADLLARRGVSVVHCPRSHAYFRHAPFPHGDLSNAGVNICLGTDSLATVNQPAGVRLELDMFHEMRALSAAHPELLMETIVRMATINGAKALGLEGKIGELRPGVWADLIALPYRGSPAQVYEGIAQHSGGLIASMIGGRWAAN